MKTETREEMLARRILEFPQGTEEMVFMTDEAIKRNVYAVMKQYAQQEVENALETVANKAKQGWATFTHPMATLMKYDLIIKGQVINAYTVK